MTSEWRALREAARLTQTEAAALAGVNKRTLQHLERGERRATPGLERWLRWVYFREARRWAN